MARVIGWEALGGADILDCGHLIGRKTLSRVGTKVDCASCAAMSSLQALYARRRVRREAAAKEGGVETLKGGTT